MAQRTTVTLVDDRDGTEDGTVSTVDFGLDGASFLIDLSEPNAAAFRSTLAPFVARARRVGRDGARRQGPTRPPNGGQPQDREENRRIREWARGQGYGLSSRGRIPDRVTAAYYERGAMGPET